MIPCGCDDGADSYAFRKDVVKTGGDQTVTDFDIGGALQVGQSAKVAAGALQGAADTISLNKDITSTVLIYQ